MFFTGKTAMIPLHNSMPIPAKYACLGGNSGDSWCNKWCLVILWKLCVCGFIASFAAWGQGSVNLVPTIKNGGKGSCSGQDQNFHTIPSKQKIRALDTVWIEGQRWHQEHCKDSGDEIPQHYANRSQHLQVYTTEGQELGRIEHHWHGGWVYN